MLFQRCGRPGTERQWSRTNSCGRPPFGSTLPSLGEALAMNDRQRRMRGGCPRHSRQPSTSARPAPVSRAWGSGCEPRLSSYSRRSTNADESASRALHSTRSAPARCAMGRACVPSRRRAWRDGASLGRVPAGSEPPSTNGVSEGRHRTQAAEWRTSSRARLAIRVSTCRREVSLPIMRPPRVDGGTEAQASGTVRESLSAPRIHPDPHGQPSDAGRRRATLQLQLAPART